MISGVNLKSGKICSVMAEKIVSVEKTDSDFGWELTLVTDVNGDRYKVLLPLDMVFEKIRLEK